MVAVTPPSSSAANGKKVKKTMLKKPAAQPPVNRKTGMGEGAGEDRMDLPRDMNKSLWFKGVGSSQIPAHIKSMFTHNEKTPGQRRANTDLINSIVLRDNDGKYKVDIKNPALQDLIYLL